MRLPPFRIERWYERYEFTTELQLSSSDCESVSIAELLALEPDARKRLESLHLGYTVSDTELCQAETGAECAPIDPQPSTVGWGS